MFKEIVDFTFDSNWNLTGGEYAQGIDHTLNADAGHYSYYNPQFILETQCGQIQTTNLLPLSTDCVLCFYL